MTAVAYMIGAAGITQCAQGTDHMVHTDAAHTV